MVLAVIERIRQLLSKSHEDDHARMDASIEELEQRARDIEAMLWLEANAKLMRPEERNNDRQ